MSKQEPWWDRLNSRLFPYLGPPPLGPYETEAAVHSDGCPICGLSLIEHEIERRPGRPTQMHCPAAVA